MVKFYVHISPIFSCRVTFVVIVYILCVNITEYFELYNEKDLTVDNITLTKSYKCDSNITHSFSSSTSNNTAVLTTTLLQLQAFQFNSDNGDFGPG